MMQDRQTVRTAQEGELNSKTTRRQRQKEDKEEIMRTSPLTEHKNHRMNEEEATRIRMTFFPAMISVSVLVLA